LDRVAIVIGACLIAVGIGGFVASGNVAPTALIPAYVGVVLAICGMIVLFQPTTRKHVMHLAATIGLLGFLAAIGRPIAVLAHGGSPPALAMFSFVSMALLCGLFVILAVRSFIAARRARLGQ
jgi:hypothetical protein